MGKKKPKVQVTQYYRTIHLGVCMGVADRLLGISVGDLNVGILPMYTLGYQSVKNEGLFGGIKEEGGVSGKLYFLPGDPDQVFPSELAAKFSLTSDTMPAYRGQTTLFFTNDSKGFYWCANTPYMKTIAARVQRIYRRVDGSDQWYKDKAGIPRGFDGRASIHFALDCSTSMATTRLPTLKAAMVAVLNDLKGYTANGGLDADVLISCFGLFGASELYESHTHCDSAGYDSLITFVNGLTATANNTDFRIAADRADTWFRATASDTTIGRRVFVFITDGVPTYSGDGPDEYVAAEAQTTMSDELNNSGVFAGAARVDCFAFNIDLTDVTYTSYLDNTPWDGVPVLSGTDYQAMETSILTALATALDINPVHYLREAMESRVWGMGAPTTQFNDDMWKAAADTIFNEKLGVTILWSDQSTIEDFANELITHMDAAVYLNPRTGLWDIKLIRSDYDVDTLEVLDKTNCKLIDFQDRQWDETINEVSVTWTNPETEDNETVTLQDPANIDIQNGEIVSDSKNFYGFRTNAAAMYACERCLRGASSPWKSATVQVPRSAVDYLPGTVLKLNFPEKSISNRIMRVGPIDYGAAKGQAIQLSLSEDIYSTPPIAYVEAPKSEWVDPSESPAPADATEIMTLPYYLAGSMADPSLTAGAAYPEVFAGVLAARGGSDTIQFELEGEETDAVGNTDFVSLGVRSITSRTTLLTALVQEGATTLTLADFDTITQGSGITISGLLVIGSGADEDMELAIVADYTDPDYTIWRGVLDTTPKDWPIGTPVWFLPLDWDVADNTIRSDGETVDYKVLTMTSLGTLDESLATAFSEDLNARPWLPTRPADVIVNSVGFGSVDCTGLSTIPVTWVNRNRLTEDTQILDWTDATVTPETGQTTTVVILAIDRTVVGTISGLTGTSYDIPIASFGSEDTAIVRVEAERDGFTSLQGHEITVILNNGYGDNYGDNYGGGS